MTAFENDAPNRTFCTDGDLATVSFMNPFDVGNFIEDMTKTGLRFLVDGEAQDMVVVDQHQGPCNRCDWIKFGMQGPNIFLLDWN